MRSSEDRRNSELLRKQKSVYSSDPMADPSQTLPEINVSQRRRSVEFHNASRQRLAMPGGSGVQEPDLANPGMLCEQRKALKVQVQDRAQEDLVKSRHVLEAKEKARRQRLLDKVSARTTHFRSETKERVQRREDLNTTLVGTVVRAERSEEKAVSHSVDSIIHERLAGKQVFVDEPNVQRADHNREPKMHKADRALFARSTEMKDYRHMHVGDPRQTALTATELKQREEQEQSLAQFKKLERGRNAAAEVKAAATEKLREAEAVAEDVRQKSEQLNQTGVSMSFEARSKARRKLLVQKEEGDHIMHQAEHLMHEAQHMRKNVHTGAAAREEAWLTEIAGDVDDGTGGNGIKMWLIGDPSGSGMGDVYYGNYTPSDTPPEEGWLPFGPNAKWPAPSLNVNRGAIVVWQCKKAGEKTCNGSFTKAGKSDGVGRFQKSDGLTLFRTTIKENADLGLTADVLNAPAPEKEATTSEEEGESSDDADAPFEEGEDPPALQELMDDPFDYGKLQKAGVRLALDEVRRKREYRLMQKNQGEREAEKIFNETLKMAGSQLNEHSSKKKKKGGEKKDGMGSTVAGEKHAQEQAALKALQAPNFTMQKTEEDIALILGRAPRVFHLPDASKVPPLCREWVFLACGKRDDLCSGRHYYTDDAEKEFNTELRTSVDMRLEIAVLRQIAKREVLLKQLKVGAKQASKHFQSHTEAVKFEDVEELLALIEQARLVSVLAAEAVVKWRTYVQQSGKMMEQHGVEKMAGGGSQDESWSVCITNTGKELYGASTAFMTQVPPALVFFNYCSHS
jgi:hypothetical protein